MRAVFKSKLEDPHMEPFTIPNNLCFSYAFPVQLWKGVTTPTPRYEIAARTDIWNPKWYLLRSSLAGDREEIDATVTMGHWPSWPASGAGFLCSPKILISHAAVMYPWRYHKTLTGHASNIKLNNNQNNETCYLE